MPNQHTVKKGGAKKAPAKKQLRAGGNAKVKTPGVIEGKTGTVIYHNKDVTVVAVPGHPVIAFTAGEVEAQ